MGEAAQLQLWLDMGAEGRFISHFTRREGEDESENEEACGIQG